MIKWKVFMVVTSFFVLFPFARIFLYMRCRRQTLCYPLSEFLHCKNIFCQLVPTRSNVAGRERNTLPVVQKFHFDIISTPLPLRLLPLFSSLSFCLESLFYILLYDRSTISIPGNREGGIKDDLETTVLLITSTNGSILCPCLHVTHALVETRESWTESRIHESYRGFCTRYHQLQYKYDRRKYEQTRDSN